MFFKKSDDNKKPNVVVSKTTKISSTKKIDLKPKNDGPKEADKKTIKEVMLSNKPHKGKKEVKNTPGYVLELKNVYKTFTNGTIVNPVLKGISMSIKEGEFVVILGQSGSGKTTLMNIMSGLNRPSKGDAIIVNHNIINLKDSELTNFRRHYIGYIFQEYGLLSTLTVYENVMAGFGLNPDNKDKSTIDNTLAMVNLSEHKKKYPEELSGGQQQRVAIARAVAKNPKIIFGDEPTGAVDTKMSQTILEVLRKVNKEKKTTVIIITHDKRIAKIADVVYHISNGLIKETYRNEKPLEPKEIFMK